ncbi:MAG: PRD domain-containing protein [Firmicutes bacterium]|nr:PRD domain-containing protein [Bacillota bacterium]
MTELLARLRQEFSLSSREVKELEKVLPEMFDFSNSHGFDLDDMGKLGLAAHMVSFLQRLQARKMVADIGAEVRAQIDSGWMRIARQMTGPLFQEHDLGEDESEIALIALHLGAAKARAEEAKQTQKEKERNPTEVAAGGAKDQGGDR